MKLPRHHFEYVSSWQSAPMAYWVHVQPEGEAWPSAAAYIPPAPPMAPHRGYLELQVEVSTFVFRFSSPAQLLACIDVLSRTPLPPTRRLSEQRGGNHGPNAHWLSRLPAKVKAPKFRSKAVAALRAVIEALGIRASDEAFREPRGQYTQNSSIV